MRSAVKPERAARLPLSVRHRLQAAAHDLGDVGGVIDREPDEHRREFRREADAADDVEALEHGQVDARSGRPSPRSRRPAASDRRRGDAQATRAPTAAAPAACGRSGRRARAATQQRDDRPDRAALDREPRQEDAAHRKIGRGQRLERLPHRRQRAGQRDPEEQLQHQRRVADDLDIGVDEPREQRIAGGAQRGRARRRAAVASAQPDDRELQRVEQADQDRARVGVAGAIDDQRFRDVEIGGLAEIVEARRHAEPMHARRGRWTARSASTTAAAARPIACASAWSPHQRRSAARPRCRRREAARPGRRSSSISGRSSHWRRGREPAQAPAPERVSGTAANRAGRPGSRAGSGRGRSRSSSTCRDCARRSRRSSRPS